MTEQLTREQILAMSAGRKLDKVVNEKLFGFKFRYYGLAIEDVADRVDFSPSTYLPNAWEVLSRFPVSTMERIEVIEGHTTVHITLWPSADTENKYSATASANTFELAVCRAALLAVMGL